MLCLVQSRLNSKRFPNKALKKINNKELILRVFYQLKKCKQIKKIYFLIPNTDPKMRILKLLRKNKINYFLGDEINVYKRFFDFLKKRNERFFIRISGDSPLLDPTLLELLIKFHKKNIKFDIITNVFPRSFPKGQSIEIIKKNIFMDLKNMKMTSSQKEHITSYFYKYHKKYMIKNYYNDKPSNKLKLSVDTKIDYLRVSKIIKSLEKEKKSISLDNIYSLWKKK